MPATLSVPARGRCLRPPTGRAPSTRRCSIATIAWAHSSDLADPTPWLEPGQLLLTDGAQFIGGGGPGGGRSHTCVGWWTWVLAGLGFAVDVIHDGGPAGRWSRHARSRGCRCSRCPARPRSSASSATSRMSLRLTTQRAGCRGRSTRSGPSRALPCAPTVCVEILRDARRSGSRRWVALYDATGEPGARPRPDLRARLGGRATVDREVRRLLDRGLPASLRTLEEPGGRRCRRSARRVACAVSSPSAALRALGAAESDLVEAVIALASIALEQQRRTRSCAPPHPEWRARAGPRGSGRRSRAARRRRSGAALPETPFLVGMVRDVRRRARPCWTEFELQSGTRGRAAVLRRAGGRGRPADVTGLRADDDARP